jgi:hypothetical protein
MKMENTERPETSAYKIQTPGINPKERKQHAEHGENLKSTIFYLMNTFSPSLQERFFA